MQKQPKVANFIIYMRHVVLRNLQGPSHNITFRQGAKFEIRAYAACSTAAAHRTKFRRNVAIKKNFSRPIPGWMAAV
jgi:hypothetical protein